MSVWEERPTRLVMLVAGDDLGNALGHPQTWLNQPLPRPRGATRAVVLLVI